MNRALAAAFAALCVVALPRCSSPASDARFVQTSLPDTATFLHVGQLVEQRCGELDCHGSTFRNLRIYGNLGLRLSSADQPLVPACTTQPELDQDYDGIVGLEPEVMSAVVADHGASPERLTFLRKPLGLESHKGGTLFAKGDDEYACITSWLAAATNTAACDRAILATTSAPSTAACLASPPPGGP